MVNNWPLWTVLEALSKTAAKLLQKVVGVKSSLLSHMLWATMIVGVVQVVVGLAVARRRKQALIADHKQVVGACLFGVLAFVATVCGFAAFLPRYGGDIGVFTFLVTLSIVPGSLFDRFWFGNKFTFRKWFGIGLAILAGYAVLGWPSLSALTKLPVWVWLGFVTMLAVTLNQVITQTIKAIDPFVKNFWGGLVTVALSASLLMFVGLKQLATTDGTVMVRLTGLSAVVGVIVVGMWCFNLVSYKKGASIALKKLVMNGTYLSTAMALGILLFDEPASWSKMSGVGIYLIAYCLAEDGTASYLRTLMRKRAQ
jgi:drug/metabolite transporter (DMT)-like permease